MSNPPLLISVFVVSNFCGGWQKLTEVVHNTNKGLEFFFISGNGKSKVHKIYKGKVPLCISVLFAKEGESHTHEMTFIFV